MTQAVIRKDLVVLWSSPIPYVVGALFHLALGMLFVDQLAVRRQAVIQPLFPLAGFLLLVMAPLLTMRSFAEEARTGTLDVLQAASGWRRGSRHWRSSPLRCCSCSCSRCGATPIPAR
jgi:hypothetical protein